MPRYLSRMGVRAEGLAAMVANPSNREEANAGVLEKAGGKLISYYFAPEENAAYVIFELSDEQDLAAFIAVASASGAVDPTEVRVSLILNGEEWKQALEQAPRFDYKPPTA